MRTIISLLVLAALVSCTINDAKSSLHTGNRWQSSEAVPTVSFPDDLLEGSRWLDRELAKVLRQQFCSAEGIACASVDSIALTRSGETIYLSAKQDKAVNNYQVITAGCLWSANCEYRFELQSL